MSRDTTAYTEDEQLIIKGIGKKYREYMRAQNYTFDSMGRILGLEESSCRDYMYFPTILRPVHLFEMYRQGVNMNWFIGVGQKEDYLRAGAQPVNIMDYIVHMENLIYTIETAGTPEYKDLAATTCIPPMAKWLLKANYDIRE